MGPRNAQAGEGHTLGHILLGQEAHPGAGSPRLPVERERRTLNQTESVMSDWNFQVSLAGVAPAGTGGRNLPTGYYTGKIVEADGTTTSTGRPQVKFRVEITDAEYQGVVRTTWIGIPQAADDNVRYYWRALFESAGYTPAQIESGVINASAGLFIGRPVTLHYTQGDKDAGTRDELKFLAPAAWEAGKKSERAVTAQAQATGSALGANAPVQAQAQATFGGMGVSVQTPTQAGGLGGSLGGLGGGMGGMGAKPAASANDLLKSLGAS